MNLIYIFIIVLFAIIYSNYDLQDNNIETFRTTDPIINVPSANVDKLTVAGLNELIYKVYRIDVNAIKNLVYIAQKLQTDGLTIPQDLRVAGGLSLNNGRVKIGIENNTSSYIQLDNLAEGINRQYWRIYHNYKASNTEAGNSIQFYDHSGSNCLAGATQNCEAVFKILPKTVKSGTVATLEADGGIWARNATFDVLKVNTYNVKELHLNNGTKIGGTSNKIIGDIKLGPSGKILGTGGTKGISFATDKVTFDGELTGPTITALRTKMDSILTRLNAMTLTQ